jgi:hypothetical protein
MIKENNNKNEKGNRIYFKENWWEEKIMYENIQ